MPFLESSGHCPHCGNAATFTSDHEWLRDNFLCSVCKSIPRERALMLVLDSWFPNWRDLKIHQAAPGKRSERSRINECKSYVTSRLFDNVKLGTVVNGHRCEDLERLTFASESIDIHITQDVMEHVMDPASAFREIARTLKPGGAHVFTVPLVRRANPTRQRAAIEGGKVVHLMPAEYHRNPTSEEGSLVATDWGFDIAERIFKASGLFTHMVCIDDLRYGIRAELNEVLVTVKPR